MIKNDIIIPVRNTLCRLFGHRWRYKDYQNHIKANGDNYDFIAARSCTRCKQVGYFYNAWKIEEKSKLDFESDYFSSHSITINKVIYS